MEEAAFVVEAVVAVLFRKLVGCTGGRRVAAEVERLPCTASHVQQKKADAPDAAHVRLNDIQRRRDGDDRVNGVSAGSQHIQTRLTGQGMG